MPSHSFTVYNLTRTLQDVIPSSSVNAFQWDDTKRVRNGCRVGFYPIAAVFQVVGPGQDVHAAEVRETGLGD